jgi:Tol biopolymer transport system component
MRRPISTVALAVASVLVAIPASAQATMPGVNGRIAFARNDPAIGDFDVWTADPDGSRQLQLTHVPSFFSDWSPDGRRIAFDFVDADGNEQIATMNPDGTDTRQLTFGPAIHEIPNWSPDGSRIAYDYAPIPPGAPGFHTSLAVMNADGSDQHLLTPQSPDTLDEEPKFSPDGTRFAFIRIRKDMGQDNQQNALFVMRADGTGLRRLTAWGQAVEFPNWSPDARWIAFNDSSTSGGSRSIYLIRPDGSGKHVVYQGQASAWATKPFFSPDGTRILFVCIDRHRTTADRDICAMNPDGSDVVDVTNTSQATGMLESFPSWGTSPPL